MAELGTVHVIDDDDAMRNSLVFLLRAAAFQAVPHDSAESFLTALPSLDFACVVTDVRMPGITGIDLLHRMQAIDKQLPVIVITGQSDLALAIEALRAGAFDFIEKPFEDRRIIAAVTSALELRSHRQQEDRETAVALIELLTERERQVLDGLAQGHANSTLADHLGVSPQAVAVHRANVMNKLNASTLSEVVRIAFIARGMVEGD
ncbi:response regulator [Mesorhizobium sp.]|uniref:response regulator n=1 Tax=Mesorhizobium sp. TaxID=1871066 RepID=UPI000FE9BA15|nr:response regulator [Mesorhizobium sp.]RWK37942.1 MAG: response regulator [Mesorhizobium sp.]RWK61606.1 MAG: response regulator [Mesorhizobium sp.]RWK90480.1 MAG: response regulator [Mesorhizobium sp.]